MNKSVVALYLEDEEYDKSIQIWLDDGGYVAYRYSSEFGIAKQSNFDKDGKLRWSLSLTSGVTLENYISELDSV